jgi:hypothetical protein
MSPVSATGLSPPSGVHLMLTYNLNEWSIPARPVLPEWPRCVTGHAAYDEQSAIRKNVAHPNVHTRVNTIFIHEYPCNNVLYYVFAHNRV